LGFAIALVALAFPTALDAQSTTAGLSFAHYGAAATETLTHEWYDGGKWRMCSASDCPIRNQDWGADALTFALYLRWATTHDAALQPYFSALTTTAPRYGAPCRTAHCSQWSDVPAWDALAALRAYEVTGEPRALAKAKAAYAAVADSTAYAGGACPEIRYQLPAGGDNKLKTLETESNAIRAALLLHAATGDAQYLDAAVESYAAVRRWFLDAEVPLYSVYVFDAEGSCRQLHHRFFASVNGNMIVAGLALAAATGEPRYREEAIETARAVDRYLGDDRGVYANLQAENDVAEPLVEAMYRLAHDGQRFARSWILRNAAAAVAARSRDGSYGRFFDGPAPSGHVTAWQTNGGLALMIAAADLAPDDVPEPIRWNDASYVHTDVRDLPTTIRFTGSSIALIGTIGEHCCEAGHARIFIDGRETFDRSGIWQNKSCSGGAVERAILFAWQWAESGTHVMRIDLGEHNAKEGGSYLHLQGYLIR
jgi:hypothetical protein